jgi:ComF family protein
MEGPFKTSDLGGRVSLESMGTLIAHWTRAARRLGGGAIDLVYPSACAGCGAEIEEEPRPARRELFCPSCVDRLVLLAGPTCLRCSAIVPAAADRGRCHLCRGVKLWFDEAVALGEYTGLLRKWILEMKRRPGDRLALAVAELIWQRCGDRLLETRPDVVVPVAIHWRRRWAHGTNSAAIMAERLARRLRVPLAAGLLRRGRNTPPQFTLPPSERGANVRGAFSANAGYHLVRARVLVVDDILTTGATCSEAARVLKRAGAAHVAAVVAARTLHH